MTKVDDSPIPVGRDRPDRIERGLLAAMGELRGYGWDVPPIDQCALVVEAFLRVYCEPEASLLSDGLVARGTIGGVPPSTSRALLHIRNRLLDRAEDPR